MSNAINTFVAKSDLFKNAVLVQEMARKVRLRGLGEATKYPVTTEKVAEASLYVQLQRKAEEAKVYDGLIVGEVTCAPSFRAVEQNGRQTGSFLQMTFFAESVKSKGRIDISKLETSEDTIDQLNTGNGEVTDILDFEKTFGDFTVINTAVRYFRDPVTNQKTDEIELYVVSLSSEKMNETYTVKVLDVNSDVRNLPRFSKVRLSDPTGRIYQDNSQAENVRASISITAQDIVLVSGKDKSVENPKTQPSLNEANKPQHNESNKSKNNSENK